MKIIITGSTGFIGSAFFKKFKSKYDFYFILNKNLKKIHNKKKSFKYDNNVHELKKFFIKIKPDAVIHFASCFKAEHNINNIDNILNTNIIFATHLLECMTHSGCKKFINAGTIWQNYKTKKYNPVCLYAASKQAFQDIEKYYFEVMNISFINLKIYDTYGPNDFRGKIIQFLLNQNNSKKIIKMGNGDQILNLVYIDDIINAFNIALKKIYKSKNPLFKTYSLPGNKKIKLLDLVELIKKLFNKDLNVEWNAFPKRKREILKNNSKIKSLPGWKAKVLLESGLIKLKNELSRIK